jgi:2-isopropylmalate synthase
MSTTVYLYDSTLRDGAQAEGISFSVDDKLLITRRLDELGIHYIEGGWPNPKNPKDLEFFERVKTLPLQHARITAFGSTRRAENRVEDDPTLNTLLEAGTEVIALFGKSWGLHVRDVLRTTPDQNLKMIEDSVAFLKSRGRAVIYDAEHFFDGYKEHPEYAIRTLLAAQEGGANILVLCDTNGACMPLELMEIIEDTKKAVSIPFGIHTHNDAGMAAANSIIAVKLGATQVQGTCNGYGERCGNANLCTVIPNLKLRMGIDCMGDEQLKGLMALSRFVSETANVAHDHRQPYVGESAFAHKGGAHVDGVLKSSRSFEHVSPELVGNKRRFLTSDQAGGGLIVERLKQLGYRDVVKRDPRVQALLDMVKQRENEGYAYEAAEASFELLVRKVMGDYMESFQTGPFRTVVWRHENGRLFSEAIVEVRVDGEEEHTVAKGDGPVNALDRALRKALEKFYPQLRDVHLEDYKVRVLSSTASTAASVRVLIESSDRRDGDVWSTVGASENIIEASWEALVDSLRYKLLKDLNA